MRIVDRPRRAGPRPTVVCLHASASTGAQWKGLRDLVGHAFDVLTPDLHGHASGPTWSGGAGIVDADTERIARIAQSAGDQVHLVGHSYGGVIALRVALQRPELVASVAVYEPVPMRILFDHSAKGRAAAEVVDLARAMARDLNGDDRVRAAQRFIDYWSGAAQYERMDGSRRDAIAACMPVVRDHFRALAADTFRLRDYGRLAAPLLHVAGRETRASARRMSELLRFALPGAQAVTMDGMGHLGPLTHPGAVAARIARFVFECGATRARSERRAA